VGRRVNLPRLNTQADLLTENLCMCLVDANWQYFDDKVPVVAQTNSQFDDEYRLVSYLGVEVAPWLKTNFPGLPLSYNTMPYDPQ